MADYTRNLAADVANPTTVDNNAKAEAGAEPPMVQVALWEDEFGAALDAHWTEGKLVSNYRTTLLNGSAVESGDKLRLTSISDGAPAGKIYGVYTPAVFNDGVFEFDVENFQLNQTDPNFHVAGFMLYKDANNHVWMRRNSHASSRTIQALSYLGGAMVIRGSVVTDVTSFKLRLTRAGNNFTFEYDIGAGWVSFGTFALAVGADCRLYLYSANRYNLTKPWDALYARITGSGYYWGDSPEADIVDSANIGGGESYAFDAGAGGNWTLTGASSVEDGDGGTNKWKVGFSDAADGSGITWDAAWRTIAEVNTNAANGDYDGHRYLYVKWQGNSDGTQNVNATSFTISGSTAPPIHTWTQDATQHKEGASSFKQVGPGPAQSDDYYMQEIDVVAGEDYYVEVFGKCTGAPTAGYFYLQAYDVTGSAEIGIAKLSVTSGGEFVKFAFYFTVPASCVKVEIRVGGNVKAGIMYWDCCDGIRIRAKGYV